MDCEKKGGYVYSVIRVTTIPLLPQSTSEAKEEKTDGRTGGAGSILGDIWRLVYPVTDLCPQIYEM